MASSEFTFVCPSSGLLSANPVTSTVYSIDCHTPQSVFSPINYTLPTTIQFPTPPATSVPFGVSSFGSCTTEAATNPALNNVTCVPWSNECVLPSQSPLSSLSSWPDVSLLSECALLYQEPDRAPTFENSNLCLGKFTCDIQSQTRCKRKAVDIPEDCWIPTKIHVNEERMSACMNDLRLDNNNIGAQPNFENEMWYSQDSIRGAGTSTSLQPECLDVGNVPPTNLEQESCRFGLNGNYQLELCSELQFGMITKEILPKAVLEEVVKSSMQVVLWKPPENVGPNVLNNFLEAGKKGTNIENSNTQNESVFTDHSAFNADSPAANFIRSDKWLSNSCHPEADAVMTTTVNECEEMDL